MLRTGSKYFSRSQSPTGNATERLCLHNLVSMKAEPSVIHSHTEYGNEKREHFCVEFLVPSLRLGMLLRGSASMT
jgi:hypothetical protein